ncbi:hypothetical protein SAMN02910298_02364 [Pseudobutyrivibrio sp. YE44]|uniref:hypothetical protein n=1 Tax=Pseudobutyrivibrio sp. YE44 TaxID=1520802 RepID=UPI00088F67DA|nr:hypothetical protein [Pseudobutyrivibrio sp. YE44]SDB46995.1 hypothetical protein SAMN02910298_02364 [Pseudobutyrivibrio sp. YE44]
MKKQDVNKLVLGLGIGLGIATSPMVVSANELQTETTGEANPEASKKQATVMEDTVAENRTDDNTVVENKTEDNTVAESKAADNTEVKNTKAESGSAVDALKKDIADYEKADAAARQANADYIETAGTVKGLVAEDAKDMGTYAKEAEEKKKDLDSLSSENEGGNKILDEADAIDSLNNTATQADEKSTEVDGKVEVVENAYNNAKAKVEAAEDTLNNIKESNGLNEGQELSGNAKKALDEADEKIADAEKLLNAADTVDMYKDGTNALEQAEKNLEDAQTKDDQAKAEVNRLAGELDAEKTAQIEQSKNELDKAKAEKTDADAEYKRTSYDYEVAKTYSAVDLDNAINAAQDIVDEVNLDNDNVEKMKRDLPMYETAADDAKKKYDEAVEKYGEDSEEAHMANSAYVDAYMEYEQYSDSINEYEYEIRCKIRDHQPQYDEYFEAVKYKDLQENGETKLADLKNKQAICDHNVSTAQEKYDKISSPEGDCLDYISNEYVQARSAVNEAEDELNTTIDDYETAKTTDTASLDKDIEEYNNELKAISQGRAELSEMEVQLKAYETAMNDAKTAYDDAVTAHGEESEQAKAASEKYQTAEDDYCCYLNDYNICEYDIILRERELCYYEDNYNHAIRFKNLKESGETIIEDLKVKKTDCENKLTETEENYRRIANLSWSYDSAKKTAETTADALADAKLYRDNCKNKANLDDKAYKEAKELLDNSDLKIDWNDKNLNLHNLALTKLEAARANKTEVEELIDEIKHFTVYEGVNDIAINGVREEAAKVTCAYNKVNNSMSSSKDTFANDLMTAQESTNLLQGGSLDSFIVSIWDYSADEKVAAMEEKVRSWKAGLSEDEAKLTTVLFKAYKNEIKSQFAPLMEVWNIPWDKLTTVAQIAIGE